VDAETLCKFKVVKNKRIGMIVAKKTTPNVVVVPTAA
jgi:hypothetical protein